MEEEEEDQKQDIQEKTEIVGMTISDDSWYSPLTKSMYDMAKNNQLCDTQIITTEGDVLSAHSTVLASRSDILKQTFLASRCSKYKITTEEISSRSWSCLLEFMYLGTVDLKPDQLKDILIAADVLEMDVLKENCSSAIDMQRKMGTLKENENKTDQETQIEPEIMKFAAGMTETLQFVSTIDDENNGNEDNEEYQMQVDETQEGNEAVYYMVQEQTEGENYIIQTEENSVSTDGTQLVTTESPVRVETVTQAPFCESTNDESSQVVGSATHILPGNVQLPAASHIPGTSQNPSASHIPGTSQIDSITEIASTSQEGEDNMPSKLPAGILPYRGRPRQKFAKLNPSLKCHLCEKVYASKQSLDRHISLHSNMNPFTCDQCGKSFKTDRYLHAHMERHNVDRSFQCPICGKSFKTQRDANWHKKTVHSSVRSYSCEYCSYSTKTRALLNQHMLSHTSSKEWACKTCGKTFLRKQHLEQHATRHEGKRQYMCSSCGAEFYTIYACKEHHMRVHQGIKRYECSVCHQQYNEKKSFMKHLQKHSVDLVLKLEGGDIVIEQTIEDPNIA